MKPRRTSAVIRDARNYYARTAGVILPAAVFYVTTEEPGSAYRDAMAVLDAVANLEHGTTAEQYAAGAEPEEVSQLFGHAINHAVGLEQGGLTQ